MRKLLFGLIIGMVIALPIGAIALNYTRSAPEIVGAECEAVTGNDGNQYPANCLVNVDKFNDGGNTCYIAVGGTGNNIPAISCVRYAK